MGTQNLGKRLTKKASSFGVLMKDNQDSNTEGNFLKRVPSNSLSNSTPQPVKGGESKVPASDTTIASRGDSPINKVISQLGESSNDLADSTTKLSNTVSKQSDLADKRLSKDSGLMKSFESSIQGFKSGLNNISNVILSPISSVDKVLEGSLNSIGSVVKNMSTTVSPISSLTNSFKEPQDGIKTKGMDQFYLLMISPEKSFFGKFLLKIFNKEGLKFESAIDSTKDTGKNNNSIIAAPLGTGGLLKNIGSFGSLVKNLISGVSQFLGWFFIFTDFFKAGGGLSKLLDGDIIGSLKTTFLSGVKDFGMNFVDAIKLIFVGAVKGSAVGGLLGTIFPVVGNGVGALIGAVLGGLYSLVDILINTQLGKDVREWFKKMFNNFKILLGNMFEGFKKWFISTFPETIQAWSNFINIIKDVWNNSVNKVKDSWNGVSEFFGGLFKKVLDIWDSILNNSKASAKSGAGKILGLIESIGSWVVSNVLDPVKQGLSSISTFFSSITEYYGAVSQYIGNAPKNNIKDNSFTRFLDVTRNNDDWQKSAEYKALDYTARDKMVLSEVKQEPSMFGKNSGLVSPAQSNNITVINQQLVPQAIIQ